MHIAVNGQHLEVTASLKQYVEDKLGKIIHHFDHLTQAQVVLHIEKDDHIAEANIHAKGTSIQATGLAENMYAAIDAMVQKLDRQVLKHKEKITNHRQAMGAELKTE